MGACCSFQENQKESQENIESFQKIQINNIFNDNGIVPIRPQFDLEIEGCNHSKSLISFIKKIKSGEYKNIQITKVTVEFIWNILRFYFYNLSETKFLIYDLREITIKKEKYLEYFQSINKLEKIKDYSSDEQIEAFEKKLKDKNILVIPQYNKIEFIEELIEFICERKLNSKIYLFDNNYSSINNFNEKILDFIDIPNFFNLPFIFLSLRFFKHLNNNSLVFLEFNNMEKNKSNKSPEKSFSENNFFSNNEFSNKNFWDQDILNFFEIFNLGLQIKLVKNNFEYSKIPENINEIQFDYHSSILDINLIKNNKKLEKEFKDRNSSNNYDFKIKSFDIVYMSNLDEFNSKKDLLLDLIQKIKIEIDMNKSILIQIDNDIPNDILISFLFLFVWKITQIDPSNILDYFKENLFFIQQIKDIKKENLIYLFSNLQKNFKMPNVKDPNILKKSNLYQTINSNLVIII